MPRLTQLNEGDTVAYTKKFLQSIGAYDYETGQRRAKVVGTGDDAFPTSKPGEFLRIQWSDEEEASLIRRENVCRVTKAAGILDPTV